MNYKRLYDSIIERGKVRVLEGYSERHHIIPRCMGGTNDSSNLVNLTPEEHYLCHQLLIKIYPNNAKLLRAALMMKPNNITQKRNNKLYGWIKRRYSEYMKGPNNPAKINPCKGKNHPSYGKKLSKDHFSLTGKKTLSDKMKGEKNPCANLKAWNHPRATNYSKGVWSKADLIYNVWKSNDEPSYCKLYTLFTGSCYINDTSVIGPYMNLVKYFRKGWVPTEDNEWMTFKNE